METKAADYKAENLQVGGIVKDGDTISYKVTAHTGETCQGLAVVYCDKDSSPSYNQAGLARCEVTTGTEEKTLTVYVGQYNSMSGELVHFDNDEDLIPWKVWHTGGSWEIIMTGMSAGKNTIINLRERELPAQTAGTGATGSSEEVTNSRNASPHTHAYSWITVQEANAGQDGMEEYRCSCGDVQGRSVIPAGEVFVKGLYGEIKNAPQNGTATFDSGRLYTISDYVIKKLAERTDVTTVITFEYQNQVYQMTIPAGADFTGLLADEDYFYGYFYFANAVGAAIDLP